MALENKKQIFIIVGALAVGVFAVFLISNYVKSSIENQTAMLAEQANINQKKVVAQIESRTDQQLGVMAQEVEAVKKQAAQAQEKEAALIQQARDQARAQMAMQVIQKAKVRKPSLALKTPDGKRAVTVQIDSLNAVGGLINAGDFVDVIARLNIPTPDPNDKKTVTAMIFQGVEVLAVNTNINDPGAYDEQQAGPLRVTLAVDPQEAGLLSFADKNGVLELALRSPNETEHAVVKADTWKTLTDYVMKDQGYDVKDPDGQETATKATSTKPNIQIFRGGKEL